MKIHLDFKILSARKTSTIDSECRDRDRDFVMINFFIVLNQIKLKIETTAFPLEKINKNK